MPEHTGEGECLEVAAEADALAKPKRLRYALKCSIGHLSEAPGATADLGYTDDLETAIWHSEHSPYPGWDVYDNETGHYAGGGDIPDASYLRVRIQAWIAELTRPGWATYPYLGGDEVSRKHREAADAEALSRNPGWRPAPEAVLAPLRAALYVAMGIERAWADEEPPGRLAIYPDGRDLDPSWSWDGERILNTTRVE